MSFLKDTTIIGDLTVTGNMTASEILGADAITLDGISVTSLIRSDSTTNLNQSKITNTVFKNWQEVKNNLGNISGIVDLSITNGNTFIGSITGNTTFTFTFNSLINTAVGFSIILTNSNLGYVTWPTNVKWPNKLIPTLSGYGIDILSFMSVDDGTTWLGVLCGNDYI